MKWLPEPSVPSWFRQPASTSAGSKPASTASASSSAIRGAAVATTVWFVAPADSGIARSIASRSGRRSSGRSARENRVRTAIIPQPMSTPTAAGMTAPRVGMTDPTVAPSPRWASGISARCGNTKGIREVVRACCSVCSSSIDAQERSRLVIFCMLGPCRTTSW